MESFIHNWGYIALFLYSFGGGMLALAIAGVFSFSGELNIYTSIIVAFSANFIGDQFLFYIARTNKSQAKAMMQKHKRKIALAHLMMKKYGKIVVFLQKYIYGIKTLIPLAMGLTKFNFKTFTIFNFFASILWAIIVGYSAYIMGDIIYSYTAEIKQFGIYLILILLLVIYYFYKKL